MPKVILIMPEGESASRNEHQFDVAPVVGSIIELRVEGERHFYRVDETWHAEGRAAGRIHYFAALAKEDAPERWATPEAYVVTLPDPGGLAPSVSQVSGKA